MKLPFFLARRFVAGESFNDAVPKVKDLNNKGIKVTLDFLGENVTQKSVADATVKSYCHLIDGISIHDLEASISVKLTMMGFDIDTNYCRDNLFLLLEKAKLANQFVRIDMEGSAYTEKTLRLFSEAQKIYPDHVGIVIQSYLHRTNQDIQQLVHTNTDVRLCKGAYKEPADIALQNMSDIRAAFKNHVRVLLNSDALLRIATHDDDLIDWVKEHAKTNAISKDRFEFQMLYGLRLNTCENLIKDGYNVRVYVPYGTMWLPYFSRRLRERKENIWFILSTVFQK